MTMLNLVHVLICGVLGIHVVHTFSSMESMCRNDRKLASDAIFKDCRHVSYLHESSGIYRVKLPDQPERKVYCEMSHGHAWTVIQRRINGAISFQRTYEDFRNGFGFLSGEFWIGNDMLHNMTKHHGCVLRVDLEDFDNKNAYAQYNLFRVEGPEDGYRLKIGEYSGNATDSLKWVNHMKFTTMDMDQDSYGGNCALLYEGGWWYHKCHRGNLNGLYVTKKSIYGRGVQWSTWKGFYTSLKSTKLMIRC